MISQGELLDRPKGDPDGRYHACLIESYDFENDRARIKNSWGLTTDNGRCDIKYSALHDVSFVKVHFTTESIMGKTSKPYKARMTEWRMNYSESEFNDEFGGLRYRYLDHEAAKFETSILARKWHKVKGEYEYIGVDFKEYIDKNLGKVIKY